MLVQAIPVRSAVEELRDLGTVAICENPCAGGVLWKKVRWPKKSRLFHSSFSDRRARARPNP